MLFLILLFLCFIGSPEYVLGGQAQSGARYDVKKADALFKEFVKKYHKNYSPNSEKLFRLRNFKKNLLYYNEINGRLGAHVVGINMFSDMDKQEFTLDFPRFKLPSPSTCERVPVDQSVHTEPSLDWRVNAVLSDPRDPALLLSGAAFATVGNLEAQYSILNNHMTRFSEQQIIDCGITGKVKERRLPDKLMEYLVDAGGIMSEQDYPYKYEHLPQPCKFDKNKIAARVTKCRTFDFKTEDDIKKILTKHGPVTILVAAHTWVHYAGGIYPASVCKPDKLNHAVLLVGYGTENGVDYWIMKNSWGPQWGEQGYIRIERNKNACNVGHEYQIIASVVVEKEQGSRSRSPSPGPSKKHPAKKSHSA